MSKHIHLFIYLGVFLENEGAVFTKKAIHKKSKRKLTTAGEPASLALDTKVNTLCCSRDVV